MSNPTTISWTDPTENVDGSPITPGEITGYNLGIRVTTAAGSAAGTYPIILPVVGSTAAKAMLSAISPLLAPGSYAAAVETVGPVSSAWSTEAPFTIAPPVPNAPTNPIVS
jgi:hypothetical protein